MAWPNLKNIFVMTGLNDMKIGTLVLFFSVAVLVMAGLLVTFYVTFRPQGIPQENVLRDLLIILVCTLPAVFFGFLWLFSKSLQKNNQYPNVGSLVHKDQLTKSTQGLRDAKDIAEAQNRAKSRYLTSISHELRTPLQSILGYAQLLSRDPAISIHHKESIAIIHRSGEHLVDLIEGLLDLSRIEAGKLEICPNRMNLHEMLAQISNIFNQQAAAKSIAFHYYASQKLPEYVRSDEKFLRQILLNVLSNAIKYTNEGHVKLTVTYRNQVVEFNVIDTGIGIETSEFERIFSPFERVKTAGAANVPGIGIGLSIVRFLCELLGGDISVTSVLGEGSCFTIRLMLPSIESFDLTESPSERVIGYHGRTQTVVVVDDELTHRRLIKDFLSPLGFHVLGAMDAESCLSMLHNHQPDIFLIDVSLPGMSGFELTESLRARNFNQPIIIISADAKENGRHQDARTAHNSYMVKPIKLQHLVDQLSRLLKVTWDYPDTEKVPNPAMHAPQNNQGLTAHPLFEQLRGHAEIGYVKGIKQTLDQLHSLPNVEPALIEHLENLASQQLHQKIVETLLGEHI
jgi:signal transduction histidine kinase/CheY-like chemotaxis protein